MSNLFILTKWHLARGKAVLLGVRHSPCSAASTVQFAIQRRYCKFIACLGMILSCPRLWHEGCAPHTMEHGSRAADDLPFDQWPVLASMPQTPNEEIKSPGRGSLV